MDEYQIRMVEKLLDVAAPDAAAAVAFAAIMRLGQLGPEGAAAFARHCTLAGYDPDVLATFRPALQAVAEALG